MSRSFTKARGVVVVKDLSNEDLAPHVLDTCNRCGKHTYSTICSEEEVDLPEATALVLRGIQHNYGYCRECHLIMAEREIRDNDAGRRPRKRGSRG